MTIREPETRFMTKAQFDSVPIYGALIPESMRRGRWRETSRGVWLFCFRDRLGIVHRRRVFFDGVRP